MENIDKDKEVKKLLVKIAELLKSNMKNSDGIINFYWELGYNAETLIKTMLGEKGCKLPIDIEGLAEKLGLEVKDKRLNPYLDNMLEGRKSIFNMTDAIPILNRRIAQLVITKDIYTEKMEKVIYTDEAVPPSSKRYAIANEIAHYLLYQEDDNELTEQYESYFIMPMCPTQIQELTIDIFSTFLLIPISQFFEEFKGFAENSSRLQNIPIATEEWIRYLAEKAVLSDYYTACGYQYLRSVAYWIYKAHNVDEKEGDEIGMLKKNRKLIINNTEYFSKENYEMLFQ